MLHLAQAQYLILLLIVPLLFVFYAVYLAVRRKRISKIGDPALVQRLMPTASTAKGWLK